ncbi:hypothetical protein [Dictyobacter formicarum]|uniref:Thioredoxin-like fold domain-containing protein n=1 Tax=Dictyobacter formicarum TaxID=2778368 RepID=A0ABQ3VPK2_9CHLR|nr:hypothetical protein [Dictyobacter formicarum]GHO88182.1 hypothetical protein KSZ_61880 [Dictyobacter formicarum]
MTPAEEVYKKELAPLVLGVKEKARQLGFPSLIVIQVDKQLRITGDTTNARPALVEASMMLFGENNG